MDSLTRQALEQSITAWEKKLKVKTVADIKMGAFDCPLCLKFLLSASASCAGCPVAEKGHSGCRNTPYDVFYLTVSELRMDKGHNARINARLKSVIQDEVNFLKSLRPQE